MAVDNFDNVLMIEELEDIQAPVDWAYVGGVVAGVGVVAGGVIAGVGIAT